MKPTPKLRFVERFEIIEQRPNGLSTGRAVHILQQWWDKGVADQYTAVIAGDPIGEWRDVPIEKEQT
jgi:hypothetical protein